MNELGEMTRGRGELPRGKSPRGKWPGGGGNELEKIACGEMSRVEVPREEGARSAHIPIIYCMPNEYDLQKLDTSFLPIHDHPLQLWGAYYLAL